MKLPPRAGRLRSRIELMLVPLFVGLASGILTNVFHNLKSLFICLAFLLLYPIYASRVYRPRYANKILVIGKQYNVQVKQGHTVMVCDDLDRALSCYYAFGPEVVFVSIVFTLLNTQREITALFRQLGDTDVYFYDPEDRLGCFDYLTIFI